LDNAEEAVEGPGRVTLTARPAVLARAECLELWGNASPGPHVRVEVADTGPGLGPEARARPFREPFFPSKPRPRGLGLTGGYRVQTAGSAAEAVRLHDTHCRPFRLVLSDVVMQPTSGVELARQLRSRDAGLRLLFMSGEASAEAVRRDFGGIDLLTKPFRI